MHNLPGLKCVATHCPQKHMPMSSSCRESLKMCHMSMCLNTGSTDGLVLQTLLTELGIPRVV